MIFKAAFFSWFYLFCACCGLTVPVLAQTTSSKPNIIFILTDDLGYGDIGVFFQNQRRASNDRSKPFELTPHIDQLANTGAIFTQQYSNAPVCAPSRASLLTGVNQANAHIRNNQFDKALENNHTIATVLKQSGYATMAIGKWGLQGEKEEAPYWPAHPLKRGFDHYFGYMRHADGHEHYPVEGIYRGRKEVWEDYKNVTEGLDKCYTTDLWTAKAKQWIINHKEAHTTQPFFMFLAYDAPHAVLELPTQAYPPGGGLKGGLQWNNQPGQMINTASGIVDSYIYPEYAHATYDNDNNAATPEIAWPDTYKRYATSVKRIDDAVGDVLKLLKDLRIDNNTIVIFTSDNGSSIESYLPQPHVPNLPTFFGSYGPFDGIKRDCWEGGVRVPTVAAWPGHIEAGKVIDAPSMLSDWLSTFADVAKVPAPVRTNGVSLLPSLTGNGKQEESQVYVEYFEGGRTPDFKEFELDRRGRTRNQMQLIRFNNLAGVRYNIQSADDDFEIYNVADDPKQTKNLASLPGYSKMQSLMKAKILQFRRPDANAKRPYDTAFVPSINLNKKLQSGFKWKFYAGNFPYVASIKNSRPGASGITPVIKEIEGAGKKGIIVYEAFIKVPQDGKYNFSFQTSGKAFIRLHEAELFDTDFSYIPGTLLTHNAYLKKGFHPVTIYILKENQQKKDIHFQWKPDEAATWKDVGQPNVYY